MVTVWMGLAALALALLVLASPGLAGPSCGNGIVEGVEECDDGGRLDLDGCTRECRYESVHWVDSLNLVGGTAPGFCTPATNALGGAFANVGLQAFNDTLQGAIDGDQLTVLFDLLDLEMADGSDDPTVEVGVFGGARDVEDPSPGGLDSWYRVDESQLDGSGLPTERLTPGAIASLRLTAGPSAVSLPFPGSTLQLLGTSFEGLVDGTSSAPAPPPVQTAPGLVAFETLDGSGGAEGLCGNVTVGSLAIVPAPEATTTGAFACSAACSGSRNYVSCGGGPVTPSCHSLLDVLVGGCAVEGICLELIAPTQPDVGVGASPPNLLVFAPSGGGIDKVVVVESDDAYSSWFALTTQRVHATNNLGVVFRDGFESGDTTGWSAP